MAKFDHERAHMAANLVLDPPVSSHWAVLGNIYTLCLMSWELIRNQHPKIHQFNLILTVECWCGSPGALLKTFWDAKSMVVARCTTGPRRADNNASRNNASSLDRRDAPLGLAEL